MQTIFENFPKPKDKNELPASLRPKKSDFGTFVFFDEPAPVIPKKLPEEPPHIQQPPKKIEKPQKKIAQKKPVKKSITKPPKKPVTKKIVQKKVIKKPKIDEKLEQDAIKLAERAQKVAKQKLIKEEKKRAEQKEAKKQERIKQIEEQEKKLAQMQQQKQAEEKLQQEPKKKRNILAMTKGFLENLKDKGEDWLERKGDDNKRPNFEELKFLSYESRINWQLTAAWKRYLRRRANMVRHEGRAVIDFELDQHGNVTSLHLLESTGSTELDDLVLETVRKAAPFPPLPKHFDKTTYATGRIIRVSSSMLGF